MLRIFFSISKNPVKWNQVVNLGRTFASTPTGTTICCDGKVNIRKSYLISKPVRVP